MVVDLRRGQALAGDAPSSEVWSSVPWGSSPGGGGEGGCTAGFHWDFPHRFVVADF